MRKGSGAENLTLEPGIRSGKRRKEKKIPRRGGAYQMRN